MGIFFQATNWDLGITSSYGIYLLYSPLSVLAGAL